MERRIMTTGANSPGPVRVCRVVTVPLTFGTLFREQMRYAAQKGIDLTLVSSPGPMLEEVAKACDSNFHPVPMARGPLPHRDIVSLFFLAKFFRDEKFDIVHSSTPKAGLLCAIAGFLAHVPVRIHTYTGQVWVGMKGVSRKIIRGCDKVIGRLNTHCYADSFSQRDFLVNEGVISESKISVLGPGSVSGVNLKRFDREAFRKERVSAVRRELGISEESFVILFVGRLTRDKGITELVSAFQMVLADSKNADLVLVGPLERERDPLPEETLGELNNNPRIHAVGFSGEPEKYMACADVFCLPSYREGFGSVVIEAGAMGIPSVASRVVGLIDAVVDGETGLLVPAGNTNALEQALLEMLSSPELRRRMGSAARERAVREFDSKIVNQLVVDEYKKLAEVRD